MAISEAHRRILAFDPVKATCILKKLKPANTLKSVSQKILHYIDEVTKYPSQKRSYPKAAPMSSDDALVPGKDYTEYPRSVFVRGFFISEIQKKTGLSPHLLEPEAMLHAVDEVWRERIAADCERKPKAREASKMHSGVISISHEYGRLITESGRDVDKMLLQIAHNVIRKRTEYFLKNYNKRTNGKKLAPEDAQMAYIVGIHHDRRHIHAHFCLYPYTKGGQYVTWSDNHRTKDYVFTNLRKWAIREAFDFFKTELYAPAYICSLGQDIKWQRHMLAARCMKEHKDERAASQKLLELGAMPHEDFFASLEESWSWARKYHESLKKKKIRKEDLARDEETVAGIHASCADLMSSVVRKREAARELLKKRKLLSDALKKPRGDGISALNPNRLERSEDFWRLLYACAFGQKADSDYAAKIFGAMIGASPRFSMYSFVLDLYRNIYKKAAPEEKSGLGVLGWDGYDPANQILRKKLLNEIESINAALAEMQDSISDDIEKMRDMSCRQSEAVFDLYLKRNIVKNKVPAIFRPSVEAEIKRRRVEIPQKPESMFAYVRRMKTSMRDVSHTPDMAYEKIRKAKIPRDMLNAAEIPDE